MGPSRRHDQTALTSVAVDLSQKILKRSVRIAGHATSISLEKVFWDLLKQIADKEGRSVSLLVEDIDAKRSIGLSSALRIYIIHHLLAGQFQG